MFLEATPREAYVVFGFDCDTAVYLLHFRLISPIIFEVHAGVAQLLERVLAKDEVQG